MNITDLEYGKVLVTGEIAFYMQHPKGRIITTASKTKFILAWISKKIRRKAYTSDVRKSLQYVRKHKQCSEVWDRNLSSYLNHLDNCKTIKGMGKTDRELVEEAIEDMKELGFHAKTRVLINHHFTESEIYRYHKSGALLLMDVLEKRFGEDGMMRHNGDLEFIASNQEVIRMATKVFLRKSFPLKSSDREDVFTVGSPNGQINTSLRSIR